MLPQLTELQVRNLALIEHASVRLDGGLNVITGETGAGKTMLAKALDLLLGAKTPRNVVRPGAEAAYIEATVRLPKGWNPDPTDDLLSELLADADGELVIARRIAAGGRSRCLIGGQTVSLETLRTVAGAVITFYGQHEQRRLMLDRTQAHLLDSSGDGRGARLHAAYTVARVEAVRAARRLESLRRRANDDQRALDLARYELEELEQLAPVAGEEPALMNELAELESAQDGQAGCSLASDCLAGSDGDSGALDLVRRAASALSGLPGETVAELASRLESAAIELDDIAGEAQQLADTWTSDPSRQAAVQSRLELIHRLQRKHQVASPDQLVEVMARLAAQVGAADNLPASISAAEKDAAAALDAAVQAAGKLTVWRTKRAAQLVKAVSASLGELAMADAKFAVRLDPVPGDGVDGLAESGAERPVFLLQANPGLPEEELSQVASGGEASRLMLALISETANGDGGLLVLDEPDAGLGGQTAHGVASRLKAISGRRQVLVISHLPQIAARADLHLRLHKSSAGGTTATTIQTLSTEEERVDELCRLGGHDPSDLAARQAVSALRSAT